MSRVAVVTGGTRGIGHAITKRLKEDGCKVAAIYGGNAEAANKTADELGVDVTPRVEVLKVTEPPVREAGVKVESAAELVEKLKNEAKVI